MERKGNEKQSKLCKYCGKLFLSPRDPSPAVGKTTAAAQGELRPTVGDSAGPSSSSPGSNLNGRDSTRTINPAKVFVRLRRPFILDPSEALPLTLRPSDPSEASAKMGKEEFKNSKQEQASAPAPPSAGDSAVNAAVKTGNTTPPGGNTGSVVAARSSRGFGDQDRRKRGKQRHPVTLFVPARSVWFD